MKQVFPCIPPVRQRYEMNAITIIMVVFSMLGAADRIFGSRFGLGKEFERGFMLLGTMALSMIGMIVISPWIADILAPVFDIVQKTVGIDPSVIPASLFANDMGGAPLSVEVAHNSEVGLFNALVVSSMMGCTISFTIPFALGVVEKEHHSSMLLGFLCGIVTIPVCRRSGLCSAHENSSLESPAADSFLRTHYLRTVLLPHEVREGFRSLRNRHEDSDYHWPCTGNSAVSDRY